MRGIGLLVIVLGWLVAIGGLLSTDEPLMRLVIAFVGFSTSLGGIWTLNAAHNAAAIWKEKGAWR
jgi:hypothetical protein